MRTTGNLAGVEFIAPPLYHPHQELWREIISESAYWFTKDTMRFFSSRVSWDTLTPISVTECGFISSESAPFEGVRRYTARYWRKDCGVQPLSEFGEFDTLRQARFYLANGGFIEMLKELRGN